MPSLSQSLGFANFRTEPLKKEPDAWHNSLEKMDILQTCQQ
jgi:hypothetical protein